MKNSWRKFENWFNKKFGWILCPPYKQGKEELNSKYNKTN